MIKCSNCGKKIEDCKCEFRTSKKVVKPVEKKVVEPAETKEVKKKNNKKVDKGE